MNSMDEKVACDEADSLPALAEAQQPPPRTPPATELTADKESPACTPITDQEEQPKPQPVKNPSPARKNTYGHHSRPRYWYNPPTIPAMARPCAPYPPYPIGGSPLATYMVDQRFRGPPSYMPVPYFPRSGSYPVNHGPPVLLPEQLSLRDRIIHQIEYYFSDVNLSTDYYLKSLMDEHGWVPVKEVAEFRRIKAMNTEIPFILYAMRFSSSVEVQGDKIRRRGLWYKWVPESKRQTSEEKSVGENGEDPTKNSSCGEGSIKSE